MFSKNQIVPVTIEDISDTGEGIGHVDGFTLFVSCAVPGDTVRARILKAKKTYAIAKAEEIITPAPGRVTPECPVAGSCGGCQLSFLSYESQLALKQKKVEDCIRRRAVSLLSSSTPSARASSLASARFTLYSEVSWSRAFW